MDSGHITLCQLLNLTLSFLPTVIQVDIFLYLISLLTDKHLHIENILIWHPAEISPWTSADFNLYK